jgi:hypothetical protein
MAWYNFVYLSVIRFVKLKGKVTKRRVFILINRYLGYSYQRMKDIQITYCAKYLLGQLAKLP